MRSFSNNFSQNQALRRCPHGRKPPFEQRVRLVHLVEHGGGRALEIVDVGVGDDAVDRLGCLRDRLQLELPRVVVEVRGRAAAARLRLAPRDVAAR